MRAGPRDTAFVDPDPSPDRLGMLGMVVGRVLLFFSFTFRWSLPCALIHVRILHYQDRMNELIG